MLSLLLLFFFNQKIWQEKPVPESLGTRTASLDTPTRLLIPAINVDATIQNVGVAPNGEMEVPTNTMDAGWFKLGSSPGEQGSAVMAGHFDGINGAAGVFMNLYKLKKGDNVYIEDAHGTSLSFVVRETRLYDPGFAEEVFSLNDGQHLNLVTCDGVWDGAKKSYSKRLVVFTDLML